MSLFLLVLFGALLTCSCLVDEEWELSDVFFSAGVVILVIGVMQSMMLIVAHA